MRFLTFFYIIILDLFVPNVTKTKCLALATYNISGYVQSSTLFNWISIVFSMRHGTHSFYLFLFTIHFSCDTCIPSSHAIRTRIINNFFFRFAAQTMEWCVHLFFDDTYLSAFFSTPSNQRKRKKMSNFHRYGCHKLVTAWEFFFAFIFYITFLCFSFH